MISEINAIKDKPTITVKSREYIPTAQELREDMSIVCSREEFAVAVLRLAKVVEEECVRLNLQMLGLCFIPSSDVSVFCQEPCGFDHLAIPDGPRCRVIRPRHGPIFSFPRKWFGYMTLTMVNTGPDATDDDRESDRNLLLGRVDKPGSSRKPPTPQRKGGVSSGQADNALLQEILQRIDELSKKAAATEQSLLETAATLERVAPAIDEIVRHQGDLSRDRADATAALSDILSRLRDVEEKMPDARADTAPVRQEIARLADRIGDLARTLDSRPREGDGRDGDVLAEVRLLGMLVSRRIDDIEKGISGIRHDIDAIDSVSLVRKGIGPPEGRRATDPGNSLPVPARSVPEGFDLEDFRATIGVVHGLRDELGIALAVLDMTLPHAGRERAAAKFRKSQGGGPRWRWRWLGWTLAGSALIIAGALIEATWNPVSDLAWLQGWM